MKLKGIGASNGISVAKVFELKEIKVDIPTSKIKDIDAELKKIDKAINDAINQIKNIKVKAESNLGPEEAAIFDAHIQVASDPTISDGAKDLVKTNSVNALFAVKQVTDQAAEMFASMDDEYMKERAADIKDVARRIINSLAGIKETDVTSIDEEVVIVAVDLTPSETALLNKKYVKGFLTDIGGRTSHAAIMARSLEIPAVLGLGDITKEVKNGDLVAMDGETGEVLINPSEKELAKFKTKAEDFLKEQKEDEKFKGIASTTSDGINIELASNIGSVKDVEGVLKNDAEAIGLFRSEFLYMDSSKWPSEDEQYKAYAAVLEKMEGKRVVVRTLDIGGDKTLSYYKFPKEMNPFLGYRAIRLCLDQVSVFKTQLRALLKASVHGKLAIMFPMIATVKEFLRAKEILEECKVELTKERKSFSPEIEVGMMVEVPAAAAISHQFAKYADFFSIGTNDLMQYTMAADRMSEKVSYLYQPLNPSILNMINMTIKGAHANGKWVGMCGEMAGDKNAIPFLIGLELDEFSMSSSSILGARRQIASIARSEAKELANKALKLDTQEDVIELLEEFKNKSMS